MCTYIRSYCKLFFTYPLSVDTLSQVELHKENNQISVDLIIPRMNETESTEGLDILSKVQLLEKIVS